MDFGTNENLNLASLGKVVLDSFMQYSSKLSKDTGVKISLIGHSDLRAVQDSNGYIIHGKYDIGVGKIGRDIESSVIGFKPGNIIDASTMYGPKTKNGVAELFLPLGTLYHDKFIRQLTCLTVTDSFDTIGCNEAWYSSAIKSVDDKEHDIVFSSFPIEFTYMQNTFGKDRTIQFDKWDADNISTKYKNWIQLGLFITFNNNSNELAALRKFSGEQTTWKFHRDVI